MDIEKLIERLRNNNIENNCHDCALGYYAFEASTALSTLQAENKRLKNKLSELAHLPFNGPGIGERTRLMAENEKLRAEVESLKKGYCAGCSIPAVKAEQIRDLTDAPKLRAELERVKRERDAAVERLREWEKFDTYLFVHNFITPEKWRGPGKEN